MFQSQSLPNDANAVNADQKTISAITASTGPNLEPTDITDKEQQIKNKKQERFNKHVTRLSKRITLYQAASTIPSFVVELNYGIKYINQCPIQPLINVFLIVHGCSSLVNGILLLSGFIMAKHIIKSGGPSPCVRRLFVASLIGQLIYLVFSIAWLVAGQVWVFGAQVNGFQSSNSTQTATYCSSNVFWTGFVIIIVTYAVWLLIILVIAVRYIIKRHKMKEGTVPTANQL
jgi:hypothetical protein